MKKLIFIILTILPLIGFSQAEKPYRSIIIDSLKALNGGRIDVKDTLLLDSLAVYNSDLSSQYTSRSLVDSAFVGSVIAGGGNTIYSADDNLAGNRVVTMGGNNLTFSGNQTTFKGIDATSANFVVKFQDNVGTDLLSVRNDGNIAVGLSTPTAQLHINSTNNFDAQLLVQSSSTSGTGISIQNTSAGGNKWTIINNGSANLGGVGHIQFFDGVTTPFFFHKDGKLGITNGTAFIPARVLELKVAGNDDGISLSKGNIFHAFLQTSSIGGYLQLRDAGGVTSVVGLNDPNSAHDFINTPRNFGIGLTTPSEKLEVNGNIKCDTLFSDAINIFSVSDTIFSAAILTLNGTPVTITSLPSSGKTIEVVSVTMRILFNTTAYATNTTLRVITATAQDEQAQESRLLLSTVSRLTRGTIIGSGAGTTDLQLVENQALTIDVDTGNPTTGDSDIIYYVTYRIITL